MSKVELHYEFLGPFQDGWTEAILRLHSVYGVQAVKLSPSLNRLTVVYDASRLTAADVGRQLRMAGLPVRQVDPAAAHAR